MAKDIVQRISLQGSEEVRRQFGDVARAGKDAFSQLERAGATGGFDRLGQSAQTLGNNLRTVGAAGQQAGQQISESFGRAGSTLDSASGSTTGFGTRFAAVAVGVIASAVAIGTAFNAAITRMVETGATAAAQLQDTADKLGVTTSKLQDLRNQAETAGASADQFEGAIRRLGQGAAQASQSVAEAAKKFTEFTVQGENGATTIRVFGAEAAKTAKSFRDVTVQGENGATTIRVWGQAAEKAAQAATGISGELQKLGINLRAFATANADQQLTMLRQAFARLPDDATRAATAARIFGENWRAMLKVVSMTPAQVEAANRALEESGRKLTQSEIDNLTAYKSAKSDLDTALAATRNRIAALFAPSKTRTVEWLTELVDANRQWLLDLAKTKQAQFETFVSGFGGLKPFLTQVLERAGELATELGRVLTTLVAPAVRLMQQVFEAAAAKINQLFGTNISGLFLGIAAAVASFTGVFGGLRLIAGGVLTIFGFIATALSSLRAAFVTGGLGAAAFWTELRLGALVAFNAIRAQLPALRAAFTALLKGDFKGAWAIVQRQGVAAFEAIKKALLDVRTPIGQLFQSLQTGFRFVVVALNGLAGVINAVFGTKLTGASLAFYAALLQISGVLGVFIPVAVGIAIILSRLSGGFVAIAAAAIILLRLFPDLGAAWDAASAAFDNLLNGDLSGALSKLQEAFTGFWTNLSQQSAATWAVLGLGAVLGVRLIIAALAPIVPAIGLIFTALSGLIGLFARIAVAAVVGFASLLGVPALLVAAFAVGVAAIIAFWPQITAAALAAWEAIKAGASALWTGVTDLGRASWEALVAALRALWEGFTGYVTSSLQAVSSFISNIVSSVMSAVRSIASAVASAVSSSSTVEGSTTDGFASGGLIRGPGTGTSDSIFARLSNGEYVVRAAAVRKFGTGFFAALNSLRLPQFATGGLVGAMAMPSMNFAPSFEGGGSRALAPVTLQIGGESIAGLLAPEDVVGKLARFSARKQTNSNGRKPAWYGA
ncbi:MAG: hypothetical protein K2Y29_00405 [Beijerinckiaceae bacterium]|nr:hypothetical protein [Beijerinckiaceae bacterium]